MKALISTWKMSFEGATRGMEKMLRGGTASEAVTTAVMAVEDNPAYCSVGYGGLPDINGRVCLDAAYMNGNTLQFGAVMHVENLRNPVLAAKALCGRHTNNLLCGRGAESFAIRQGLQMRDMRTEESARKWREALKGVSAETTSDSHDTVCVLALDDSGSMIAGTSTSGLFMKQEGRVGDTPIVGSGFYCDAEYGAAAATGLGEEVMRGCLSYEVVSRIRNGESPKEACENALDALSRRLMKNGQVLESVSLIALSADGRFGAATTLPLFPFAAGNGEIRLYATDLHGNMRESSEEELKSVD